MGTPAPPARGPGAAVIAGVWSGETRAADAEAYAASLRRTRARAGRLSPRGRAVPAGARPSSTTTSWRPPRR